jgi:GTP-binding protein
MKFVDIAQVQLKAGDGGVGCVSFRREKFVPKGGPDGGDGGRGGSVIIRANRHLSTLLDYQYKNHYEAPRGDHGLGSRRTGKSGADIVLEVPVGTTVRNVSTGKILTDLVQDGETVTLAQGGRGGRGNAAFATAINQAPRQFEQGTEGEKLEIELELKLLADVGLVGFPNAGKSTLISVISAARPKIADYPFTTLVPNLGIVRVGEGKGFVVADIPGLLEGAHLGKGLGVQFLRHIERTRVLAFLLDASRPDPKADYDILLNELQSFNAELPRKPKLILLTKMDILNASQKKALKSFKIARVPVRGISAVTGEGIKELIDDLWKKVSKAKS